MRAIITLIAILLPLAAAAQVYTWKDASGKIHYSDQPAPDQGTKSRVLSIDKSASDDMAAAQKARTDKRLDANKETKDKQDAAAKAAKEKADDEQRQKDCERARLSVQGLESGQIRYRMGANGEREALEDSARQAEIDNARRIMDATCSPKAKSPTPAPAAPAAPKKSGSGY
jgi:hypothetical protein